MRAPHRDGSISCLLFMRALHLTHSTSCALLMGSSLCILFMLVLIVRAPYLCGSYAHFSRALLMPLLILHLLMCAPDALSSSYLLLVPAPHGALSSCVLFIVLALYCARPSCALLMQVFHFADPHFTALHARFSSSALFIMRTPHAHS